MESIYDIWTFSDSMLIDIINLIYILTQLLAIYFADYTTIFVQIPKNRLKYGNSSANR